MYENGKMRPVDTIPGIGNMDKGEYGGMNLTKIYCKNFVNVTVYSQHNNKK
jgi:hypothetical protein